MENTIQIPAKPWGEAEVKFLVANASALPEEVRAELGITPVIPDNNFQADFDAAKEIIAPVVETGEVEPSGAVEVELTNTEDTIVVTQEILDENPVLVEAGVQVGDVGVATDEVPEGAMIEEVVNNDTTDNA